VIAVPDSVAKRVQNVRSWTKPMDDQDPFATIESAIEFFGLLESAIADADADVNGDLRAAIAEDADRRAEALRLVTYKLEKLEFHAGRCKRLLNDLRTMRRLLFAERETEARYASAAD
jgi:hypothetical protein